jgi:uncharacterized protein (TIGR02453 family)
MMHKETFQFLKSLKNNNNREWFDVNRSWYAAVRKGFEMFVESTIARIAQFDRDIAVSTAKEAIFRINRDIRFSKDKSPYKTNFGAFIAKGGRKSLHAGYYIHVEPGGSFLAGGIYMPSPPVLRAIRIEIHENLEEFTEIIKKPSFTLHFGTEFWGDKLKTAPKGFPKDAPGIEYLKCKHFTVAKNEADTLVASQQYQDEVFAVFRALYPLNRFLNHAVDQA